MNPFKTIEIVAKSASSLVERVAPLSAFAPPEMRRKTYHLPFQKLSPVARARIHDSARCMAEVFFQTQAHSFFWNIQESSFELYTPWVAGLALSDAHDSLTGQLRALPTVSHLQYLLELWAGAFGSLQKWHDASLAHGNLKPANLLICAQDAPLEKEKRGKQEFTPVKIVFLDGGIAHLLEHSDQMASRDTFWAAPELLGSACGQVGSRSDIYSLAACMAWHLGMSSTQVLDHKNNAESDDLLPEKSPHRANNQTEIPQESEFGQSQDDTRLNQSTGSGEHVSAFLWPLAMAGAGQTFALAQKTFQYSSRTPYARIVHTLSRVLQCALNPVASERMVPASEVAHKLSLLAEQCASLSAFSGREALAEQAQTWPAEQVRQAVFSELKIPKQVLERVVSEFGSEASNGRFWYLFDSAFTSSAQHGAPASAENSCAWLLRRTAFAFQAIGGQVLHLDCHANSLQQPFSALNRLFFELLSRISRKSPHAIEGSHGIFAHPGIPLWQLVQVLPCLRHFVTPDKKVTARSGEQALAARTESIQSSLVRLALKCLKAAQIHHVFIANLETADDPSLAVLLRCLRAQSSIAWHIGTQNTASETSSKFHSQSEFRNEKQRHDLRLLQLSDVGLSLAFSTSNLENSAESLEIERAFEKLEKWPPEQLLQLSALTALPHVFAGETLSFLSSSEKVSGSNLNWESSFFATNILARACRDGLFSELRDCRTGLILAYEFTHAEIRDQLALLLPRPLSADVAMQAAYRLAKPSQKEQLFLTPLALAHCFLEANLLHCSHAAFACLTRDSEGVPDVSTAEVLILLFAQLEERLRQSHSPDADSLVPRIREAIADLHKSMGQLEKATHYYGAVSWSTFDPKRRSILALKSFFPSELFTFAERREAFFRVIAQCENSGLLSKPERLHEDVDPNLQLTHALRKLQSLLRGKALFAGVENVSPGIEALFSLTLSSTESRAEKLPYAPRTRAIREITFSQFLRVNLGWLDGLDLYPQAYRVLQMGIAQEDGTVVVHALFTLLFALQRRLRSDVRVLLLDTIADVAARTNDETALAESLLAKAFVTYFYDGNIAASRKQLQLLSGGEADLPLALRTCVRRLWVLCDLETEALHAPEKLNSVLTRHGMGRWDVGQATLGASGRNVTLSSSADEFLISGFLLEQIDQILLYSSYSIDQADEFAASTVAQETKQNQCRRWFSDPRTQLCYLPESVARHFEGHAVGQSRAAQIHEHNSQQERTNWAADLSVELDLKYVVATSPNPEILMSLATASAQSGFFWLATRLAARAGASLARVLDELEQTGRLGSLRTAARSVRLRERATENLAEQLLQEEAVSLNYVLEFAHNLGRVLETDKFSLQERKKLAQALLKSIPQSSDGTETAIGKALRVSARKIAHTPQSLQNRPPLSDERKTG